LPGDLKKVAKYKDKSDDWPVFAKRLKRILRDAMGVLRAGKGLRRAAESKRLVKRLRRHRDELFVFLYHANVPFSITIMRSERFATPS